MMNFNDDRGGEAKTIKREVIRVSNNNIVDR